MFYLGISKKTFKGKDQLKFSLFQRTTLNEAVSGRVIECPFQNRDQLHRYVYVCVHVFFILKEGFGKRSTNGEYGMGVHHFAYRYEGKWRDCLYKLRS